MTQKGIVLSRSGTTVEVEVMRRSACDGCHQKSTCVGGMCDTSESGADKAKPMRTKATDLLGAEVGDTVELYSSDRFVLGTAFLLFVLPICLSIAAGAAAQGFGVGEGGVYAALAAGFLIPFFAVLFLMNRRASKKQYVTVTAVLSRQKEALPDSDLRSLSTDKNR